MLPDSRRLWDLNPQFISEAAGVGLGVLIWLNGRVLMQIFAHTLGLPSGSVLDPQSLESVRTALTSGANDVDTPQRTFGVEPSAGVDRLGRRIARTHILLQTARRLGLNVTTPMEVLRLLEDAPVPP